MFHRVVARARGGGGGLGRDTESPTIDRTSNELLTENCITYNIREIFFGSKFCLPIIPKTHEPDSKI